MPKTKAPSLDELRDALLQELDRYAVKCSRLYKGNPPRLPKPEPRGPSAGPFGRAFHRYVVGLAVELRAPRSRRKPAKDVLVSVIEALEKAQRSERDEQRRRR